MATYLLTWNPKKWDWDTLDAAVREVARGSGRTASWSCAHSPSGGS